MSSLGMGGGSRRKSQRGMSTPAKIALGTAAAGLLAATAVTVGRSKAGRNIAQKAKDAGRKLGREATRLSRTIRRSDAIEMADSMERARGGRGSTSASRAGRGSSMSSGRRSMRMGY